MGVLQMTVRGKVLLAVQMSGSLVTREQAQTLVAYLWRQEL